MQTRKHNNILNLEQEHWVGWTVGKTLKNSTTQSTKTFFMFSSFVITVSWLRQAK